MPIAVIWGAAGGIGRSLATQLIDRHWHVLAVARHASGLESLTPFAYEADVADSFAVQRAVMAIAQQTSEVDLMIYAVGDIASQLVEATSPEVWRRLLDANLTGAYLTTHHSLPLLTPDAHLIFVGAVHERMRLPGLAGYAAAKAGLEAFAETLRKEQRGRRVTVVRPGAVDTPFWSKAPFKLPKTALTPGDVAERILAAHTAGQQGLLDL